MRCVALLLLSTTIVALADTQSELDATLASFSGRDPVRARIQLEFSAKAEDEKPATDAAPGGTNALLQADCEGLQVFWSQEQLEAARIETSTARQAMDQLSVNRLNHYLNAAPQVLEALKGANLVKETPGEFQGRQVRVLDFKLNPPLSEKDRKYIKDLNATATIWLGSDGVPVAAERKVRVKGRVMLVIGFESEESERYEFARVGDRLVVTLHRHDARGSGGGESNQRQTIAHLTVETPPA